MKKVNIVLLIISIIIIVLGIIIGFGTSNEILNSISFENLLKAHKKARCGKREKKKIYRTNSNSYTIYR